MFERTCTSKIPKRVGPIRMLAIVSSLGYSAIHLGHLGGPGTSRVEGCKSWGPRARSPNLIKTLQVLNRQYRTQGLQCSSFLG